MPYLLESDTQAACYTEGTSMLVQLGLEHETGMRKFRIDQDFLIEHWHIIYIMPVVFAEIYF